MTITPANLIYLRNVLKSVDSFKFDSKTTYTLSRNLSWVESEIIPIEKARKKIYAESGSPLENTPEYAKYIEKWEEYISNPIEIKDLRLIKYEDLNIGDGKNEMPVNVLTGLFPIIKEESEAAPKKKAKE